MPLSLMILELSHYVAGIGTTWYSFTNLTVTSFREEKTLTLKQTSSVTEVSCHVDDNAVKVAEEDDSVEVLNNATIIGTQHFNTISRACIAVAS